jgi:hypothetical protein
MRSLIGAPLAFFLVAWVVPASPDSATTATPKISTPVKKTTVRSNAKGKTTTSVRRKASKKSPVQPVRSRSQLAPTPDRYKQIQEALAAKGYLTPDQVNGQWNEASVDALKRFQAAQNIDSTGKINSLSLIALGLGPKHDTSSAAAVPQATSPPVAP